MWERRVGLLAVCLTYLLILAGGLVHATGSGLACPDWPLCHGMVFPPMTGGIEFEHSHRLIALGVSTFTVLLAFLLWRLPAGDRNRSLRRWGTFAVALVLFQAALGAFTVIYKLPMMVKTSHLATAMLFLSTLLLLTFRLYVPVLRKPEAELQSISKRLFPWAVLSTIAIYVQIVLGALVRHTAVGTVCPEMLLCEGSLWPASHPALRLHMAHRLAGYTVGLLLFGFAGATIAGLRHHIGPWAGAIRGFAGALAGLIVLQIALGLLSVHTQLAIPIVTAHLGLGTLILMISVLTSAALHVSRRSHDSLSALGSERGPSRFSDIASLAKARLGLFVLITTVIAFVVAPLPAGLNSLQIGSALLFGMAFLVAAGAVINSYLERDSDGLMDRTSDRPLPAGRIQPKPVLYVGVVLALAGTYLLTWWVNPLTGFFGALAFVLYGLIYTPMKAKTSFSALVGAIPGALPPLIGWVGASGKLDAAALTLFFIQFFWQLPHFFAIAIYRKEEYQRAGLQVLPITQGEEVTRRLMLRYAILLIPISLFLVPLGVAGRAYFYVALILGLLYAIISGLGLDLRRGASWARGVFLYSIVYLPVLLLALLLDARF